MLFSDEEYEKCGIDIKSMREKWELFDAWRKDSDSKCEEIDALKKHIECLKSELEEAQKVDFKINHESDQIVIQRDTEPIDIASALIHSDWISFNDLREIAEHLQAYTKNTWGG